MLNRVSAAVAVAALLAFGAVPGSDAGTATSRNHTTSFAALFAESPFLGGQVPPRLYKWVNEDVSIFAQLDRTNPAEATNVRYIGISVKGTFCAEAQPGGRNGGFTHYHRVTAPVYAQGHGGQPGESNGYWLLWAATDTFESFDRRRVAPGVDYEFSPTPPPACGANVPRPQFQGPGAHRLTRAEIKRLASFFSDNPFKGGQQPPRFYRWVSADVLAFLEFDHRSLDKATALRYFGIARRGVFCEGERPSADFTSFQRLTASTWAKGHGGRAGQGGFWHLALAVDSFRMPWGTVTPGVDRRYATTRAPGCPGEARPGGNVREITLASQPGNAEEPFAFRPMELSVPAGTTVRWTNDADVFHTVTSTAAPAPRRPSGVFDRSLFRRGDTFEFRFERPGTYHYFCQPHAAFMVGTVTVTG